LEGLRKLCEKKLFENINFDTALETLLLAKETESTKLLKETLEYIERYDWRKCP
jgi:hypothetical protein